MKNIIVLFVLIKRTKKMFLDSFKKEHKILEKMRYLNYKTNTTLEKYWYYIKIININSYYNYIIFEYISLSFNE